MSLSNSFPVCVLALSFALCPLATAQDVVASATSIGSGTSSDDGSRTCTLVSDVPVIGSDCTLTVFDAAPASLGFLVVSVHTGESIDLQPGRTAYIDPATAWVFSGFVTDEAGAFGMTLPLELPPTLAGVEIIIQAIVFPTLVDGGVTTPDATSFDLTNGLLWRFGF